MKIALKYGLIITICVIGWVIIAHTLVPDPQSNVHSLGATVFFNLVHFVGIFLGIRALERQQGQKPTFKEGLKLGVAISAVYAVTVSLFFIGVLFVVGTRWIQGNPAMQVLPKWLLALQAFIGLCAFAMILGLVYSTLLSFALARRGMGGSH
jgi:preprotein translocase subunit Sec61beta